MAPSSGSCLWQAEKWIPFYLRKILKVSILGALLFEAIAGHVFLKFYLLFLFDVWREWVEVSERLRCSAHSTLEREHCFSFEMQSPFCQLSSWKLNMWLICTSHRIMWAVVFKLFTRCQKHILSVQYPQYKAWDYLGFQMLCQPSLQICTIYHRKQSSFGVIWIILQVFYIFVASELCQHAQGEQDVQGPSANGHTPVKNFCKVGVKLHKEQLYLPSWTSEWVRSGCCVFPAAMKICRCRQGFWYIILTFAVV